MWLTVREYANKHDIAINSVHKKIKKNILQSKKNKGMYLVWEQDSSSSQQSQNEVKQINVDDYTDEWQKANTQEKKVKLDLQKEKLKNLRQDTILKQQKAKFTKEKYRLEFVEGVFECFTDSFADVKNIFIELKLNKEQNKKLKDAFSKSIKKFQQKLKKHLKEQDDKQEQINETDN